MILGHRSQVTEGRRPGTRGTTDQESVREVLIKFNSSQSCAIGFYILEICRGSLSNPVTLPNRNQVPPSPAHPLMMSRFLREPQEILSNTNSTQSLHSPCRVTQKQATTMTSRAIKTNMSLNNKAPKRRYKPTSFEMNESIRAILDEVSLFFGCTVALVFVFSFSHVCCLCCLGVSVCTCCGQESVEWGEVMNRLKTKHREWHIHERRVAKFVKRLNSAEHRISFPQHNDDNATEVSSLTASISARKPGFLRKVLKRSSTTTPARRDIRIGAQPATSVNVIYEDDFDSPRSTALLESIYFWDTTTGDDVEDAKPLPEKPIYLDESNEEPSEHNESCWCIKTIGPIIPVGAPM